MVPDPDTRAAQGRSQVSTVNITNARRFSMEAVQRQLLSEGEGLAAELLCFEAGQRSEEPVRPGPSLYQVLEGEAVLEVDGERTRVGKGTLARVPAETPHTLENPGGGLLTVLATRRA